MVPKSISLAIYLNLCFYMTKPNRVRVYAVQFLGKVEIWYAGSTLTYSTACRRANTKRLNEKMVASSRPFKIVKWDEKDSMENAIALTPLVSDYAEA